MSHTQNYIDSLQREYHTNVAREHAYRTPFSNYFKALHPYLHASNDPKRIKDIGAPDYIIFKEKKGEQIPFGYIETKDITVSLDKVEKSEQMERYLKLDNVILTNYLEFRFYVYREKVATVTIAELDNTIKGIPENYAKLELWLQQFADFEGKTITSVEDLAQEMATKAQLMRDNFADIIKQTQGTTLHRQYDKFREVLLHELQAGDFVDMYAQTIAYGLFSSGLNHFNSNSGTGFTLLNAVQSIPATNPFLQELFSNIGNKEVEDDINYPINALCTIFEYTAFDAILTQIGRNNNGRDDAIIHFYETFLDKYSPETRKSRGVWYTPQPIVNFIVRSVDEVLQTHFGLKAGIADYTMVDIINQQGKTERVHKVQMLDVATGTGTFTAEAIRQIHAKMQHNMGMWNSYVEDNLLPRLHGFEILMAAYAMCHITIDLLLSNLGYTPKKKTKRLGVYLANALEESKPDFPLNGFTDWLYNEANEANRIKRDLPIMVAYGNPPYNVSSQNRNSWIDGLIAPYKAGLNEKNINPLSDDYIKFIRNAEYYIAKNDGGGVMAMITNNSYLDGIIHRQMRLHLLQTFDDIYIYDLHGSAKKKERSPDGTPDKNVFDIQQGVSIIIAVKHGRNNSPLAGESKHESVLVGGKIKQNNTPHASASGKAFASAALPQGESNKTPSPLAGEGWGGGLNKPLATLYHYSSYGARKTKYAELMQYSLKTTPWQKLQPHEPYYFFAPKDFTGNVEYESGFALNELFVVNTSGITTDRDDLVVDKDYQKLQERMEYFFDKTKADWQIEQKLQLKKSKTWDLAKARKGKFEASKIQKIAYRPFDDNFIYYDDALIGRARRKIMTNMCNNNTAILLMRSLFDAKELNTVFLSKHIIDKNFYGFQTYCFPLYLYEKDNHGADDDLFAENAPPLRGSSRTEHQRCEGDAWGANKKNKSTPHGLPSLTLGAPTPPREGSNLMLRKPNFHPEIIKQIAEKLGLAFVADDNSPLAGESNCVSNLVGGINNSSTPHVSTSGDALVSPALPQGESKPRSFTPINLLDYIYATLHSPHYRNTYKEFLKIDFPRIPYPDDAPKFWQLVALGGELRALHLMEHEALDEIMVGYPKTEIDTNIIEKVEYVEGKVFINKTQHFNNVPEIAWNFTIGGYQPAQKWLKDRKGEKLTIADVSHYGRIIIALTKTHELMQKIDEVTS